MSHYDDQMRFHRAGSMSTNASGIPDSTISKGDAESLSQFPPPPDDIPTTPLRSDFETPSPSRSTFSYATTATPGRKHYRAPQPGSNTLMPQRLDSHSESLRSNRASSSNPASPSRRTFTHNNTEAPPIPSLSPLRRNANRPPMVPSRDEWHEGSSKIVVDDAEERMLSTSFITNLLSSSEDITSAEEHTRSDSRKYYAPSYVTTDGMSAISEMTYPPPSRLVRTPPPEVPRYEAPSRSSPSQPIRPDDAQSTQPPSSFLALDDDGKSSIAPSYATFDANDPRGGSFVRTASMTRKLGARGASVVGLAPATLRRVSLTSTGPSNHASSNSQYGKGHDSMYSMPVPEDETDEQRLTIPDFQNRQSAPYSPAQPSSVGVRNSDVRGNRRTQTTGRQSMQSSKTNKSMLSSFASRLQPGENKSFKEAMGGWFGVKPLPRLPVNPNMTIAAEAEHRKGDEALPLPELANRAGALRGMLEKGYHPHQSLNSTLAPNNWAIPKGDEHSVVAPWEKPGGAIGGTGAVTNTTGFLSRARKGGRKDETAKGGWSAALDSPKIKRAPITKKQKVIAVGAFIILLLAVSLGIGLGVGMRKKTKPLPSCSGNFTGNACNLDATCVCTSDLAGRCDALASNIISLVPTMNKNFNANYTPNSMSNAVWQVQGAPPSSQQCSYQALLVDVAPTLDSSTSPNRTQWTQSAMLWTLVQSQDMSALSELKQFVADAPWNTLATDGPVSDPSAKFSVQSSGYVFDFASQTITQPSVSFVNNGQPSGAQIAQTGSTATSTLDRMYSFALASSSQRQQAMASYWRTTLRQKPEDYGTFMSTITSSPILLPFDATASPGSHPISDLLTNSPNTPFPVPLACYPGLNPSQIQSVNSIENTVFGLSPANTASQFSSSCFADRPIYGVLDILQLRLPFIDSRTGVAKQAAVLKRDVAPRTVVYSGEILSALPGTAQVSNTTQGSQLDPRQYGTLNHLNHVMLNFFTSIPDINVASALVDFVLGSPTVPPLNTSDLYKALSSIPALEVAVFGTINPSDLSYAVSSFSTPSGSLFFGTDQSLALRNWAITAGSSSVVWAEAAGSPVAVHDNSLTDSTFNKVWDPAHTFFDSTPNGITVNVGNVTDGFRVVGKFSP